MKTLIIFTTLFCSACAVPFTQLSPEVAVKQLTWKQGRFFYKVETSVKNTSNHSLTLMAKCRAGTTEEVEVKHFNLEPNMVSTFTDKVPACVGGAMDFVCDFFKR